MSLIWSSFPFDDVDRVFDEAFNGFQPNSANRTRRIGSGNGESNTVARPFRPRMDVHENKENNLVTATFELPV
ncbi:hypothetical protein AURDEDRAFT_158413 [Auricularia subglabra TFB-10046 SS5]|nr:hypothetical protein AURDEDRAFT_158413 [Auricularia subglabra TFB-10046 SS5]